MASSLSDILSTIQNGVIAVNNLALRLIFTQAGTGAVRRTMQNKARETFSVADFGAVGDGVTDDTAAIAAAWTAAQAQSSLPELVFPAGIYKATLFPNFAVNNARIIPSGKVTLRYSGTLEAVILDGGAGVGNMHFGPFFIEAPSTALDGLVVKAVHHSYIEANIRGAGVASNGVYTQWCVCTEFVIVCSINDGAWYSTTAPLRGILIDELAVGQTTAYCLFRNPVIEGPSIGIYFLNALGNTVLGGTTEGCSSTGMYFDTPSLLNKVIATDFETNTTQDILLGGVSNAVIDCDTELKITMNGTRCRVRGGDHSSIVVSGAQHTLQALHYNRFGDGSTITNTATSTMVRDCLNIGLTTITGEVDVVDLANLGDVDYVITIYDRSLATSAALTAPRTWTLPLAASARAGHRIRVMDIAGGVTGVNTLTIARAGADSINGAATKVLNAAYASTELISNGGTAWIAV